MYDFIIVGAGLFGCVLANELKRIGSVCVFEKEDHIGGTCYTEERNGITIHKNGAHIFRTNDKEIYEYISKFCEMIPYTHYVIAKRGNKSYCLPFGMGLFSQYFNTNDVKKIERRMKIKPRKDPKNLEEKVIGMIGKDLYKAFVKEYTEKQWGRKCKDLPPSVIDGIPFRKNFDYSYFNEVYQCVPKNGYTEIMEKMLDGVTVFTNVDFDRTKEVYKDKAKVIIHTGMIDKYFDYSLGKLEYRSLKFVEKEYDEEIKTCAAVVNYVTKKEKYTRSIEHKLFDKFCSSNKTIVTYEYPMSYIEGVNTPYYPINDDKNNALYEKYKNLAKDEGIVFAGRLGGYEYNQMSTTIERALRLADKIKRDVRQLTRSCQGIF